MKLDLQKKGATVTWTVYSIYNHKSSVPCKWNHANSVNICKHINLFMKYYTYIYK